LVGDGNYHSLHSGNLALRRFIALARLNSSLSLCPLCLCGSSFATPSNTTETQRTQRTQRLHREIAGLADDVGPFFFAGG
jgi:hypothetical protein